jgi:hypothetical protein
MADTDDKILSATKSKGKSALRRKIADLGQTSLSSNSQVVLPQMAKNKPAAHAAHDMLNATETVAEPIAAIVPAIDESIVETAALSVEADAAASKRKVGRPRKNVSPATAIEQDAPAARQESAVVVSAEADDQPVPKHKADHDMTAIEVATATTAVSPTEPISTPASPRGDESADPITTPTSISSSVSSIKDITMDNSANFNGFKGAMSEAQAKAQAAFEKSSSMLSEAGDFAKGNVEAMIESTKILAEGVQSMGSTMVSESRTAFEAMTADAKELAAVKSPTDFFKLQNEMVRKNFDNVVAQSSKNTEALLKLMSDAFAPMTGRVSLAVEKARQVVPMNAAPSMTASV